MVDMAGAEHRHRAQALDDVRLRAKPSSTLTRRDQARAATAGVISPIATSAP